MAVTLSEVRRRVAQVHQGADLEQQLCFYDAWASEYEEDVSVLEYGAPQYAAACLAAAFGANTQEALVLDVACGTGLVAQELQAVGFRHFHGLDGSPGMLEHARHKGLYQDLKQCLLGQEALPSPEGCYDAVVIVGALSEGQVPANVVPELLRVTKPGPDRNASEMAFAGIFCQTLLFTSILWPLSITGLELAINDIAVDRKVSTMPGRALPLRCSVRNHSQEEELFWLREDGTVDLKDGNRMTSSSLCVFPVSVEDNGISFTCRLARDASVQVSVTLDVLFPPILTGEDPPSAEEDGDVTLDCHAKANPPAQMTWRKDNTTLMLEDSRYEIFQTSELYQLKIRGAQKSDSGIYDCLAEYPGRTEQKSFHLVVGDKTVPFPTEAVIAAAVVVFLTILFAIVARRERILKCFRKPSESPSNTAL
ncbi:transmembrane and immunoglobulin domain-containing protein 1 isoform X2 [Anolis sagrei]|uniref:transmembrane and immunoglobulin domain-containing protein 1 isoform X1 n=1 Tax=Anolis sagrei TaxID=38937 RepID=UPI003520C16D